MLEVQTLRELFVTDATRDGGPGAFSAASGLVKLHQRIFVVADDETHLACFDLSSHGPGAATPIFAGLLPASHKARKAAKPDCEALLLLPPLGAFPCGALLALGSGSRPTRQRAALLALDAAGQVQGHAQEIDLASLLEPLHADIPDLNIEGAFFRADSLCLLQRGHRASSFNACIELPAPELLVWLAGAGAAPKPRSITRLDLGQIDGVPLSFTDGAALPDGSWLFSAAAEDTRDSYHDGACAGSAIGRVDAQGKLQALQALSLRCKVEGIAASVLGDRIELLMVTDADDRAKPAQLLSASLPY